MPRHRLSSQRSRSARPMPRWSPCRHPLCRPSPSAGGLVDKDALAAADSPSDAVVQYDPVALDSAVGLRVTADITAALGNPTEVFPRRSGRGRSRDTGEPAPQRTSVRTGWGFRDDDDRGVRASRGVGPWSLLAIAADAAMGVTIAITGAEALGEGDLGVTADDVVIASGTDAVLWLADGGVLAAAREAGGRGRERPATCGGHGLGGSCSALGVGIGDLSSSATRAPVVAVRRSSCPSSRSCRGRPRRWRCSLRSRR